MKSIIRRLPGTALELACLCSVLPLCALSLQAIEATPPPPTLSEARQHMKDNQPAKAAEVLKSISAQQPEDPWLVYDLAVAAYAQNNFEEADRLWQQLATRQVPDKLRDQVWTQIGNVSYRKGEPLETSSPEAALPLWEQSREAYKVALAARPKDKTVAFNLKVVETKLARLHFKLAERLLNEAKNQSLEKTIEKLQAALDHQRTAENLDPQNEQYKQEVKKTEKQLADRFNAKAEQAEKKADNTLNNPSASNWERDQAQKNLETALTDFREAKAMNPENVESQKGEQRVMEKLAKLLTQEGQRLQKEAQQQPNNPDAAIAKLDQALEKFEEALQINEKSNEAKQGEKEVKEALEKLHMKQGDKMAKEGREQAPRQPAEAAEKMMAGLQNYEQAMEANPNNQEAPPKIDALEKELPPLLNSLGKQEQQKGNEAEGKSLEKAVAHMEKAATSFDMAQQIDENNQEAKQGAEQAQKDLLRMREKLAQKNAQQAKKDQQKGKPNEQSFQTMLGWVKSDDKQKEYEEARRNKPTKYDPEQHKIYKNW